MLIEDLRELAQTIRENPARSDEDFWKLGNVFIKDFRSRYSFISGHPDGRNLTKDGMAFIVNNVCFVFETNWSRPEAHTRLTRIYSTSRLTKGTALSLDAIGLGEGDVLWLLRQLDEQREEEHIPFV